MHVLAYMRTFFMDNQSAIEIIREQELCGDVQEFGDYAI